MILTLRLWFKDEVKPRVYQLTIIVQLIDLRALCLIPVTQFKFLVECTVCEIMSMGLETRQETQ